MPAGKVFSPNLMRAAELRLLNKCRWAVEAGGVPWPRVARLYTTVSEMEDFNFSSMVHPEASSPVFETGEYCIAYPPTDPPQTVTQAALDRAGRNGKITRLESVPHASDLSNAVWKDRWEEVRFLPRHGAAKALQGPAKRNCDVAMADDSGPSPGRAAKRAKQRATG